MKTTPLHPWHKAQGARFASFAGFDMPIQYNSAVEEHKLCRRSVGLFDTSHMGRFLLYGEGAGNGLSALVSASILDMKTGEARYSLILNEQGTVIDDIFIYRIGSNGYSDPWFIVVNAGNRDKDFAWFSEKLPHGVFLEDLSEKICMIAVQGPKSIDLLEKIAAPASDNSLLPGAPEASASSDSKVVASIKRSFLARLSLAGVTVVAGHTGYTGEDGVELYYSADKAAFIWETILSKAEKGGIEAGPVGLAARDSLRFEAGMPLYGHEISEEITPNEALLSWACDFSKEFTGKEKLLTQKEAGLKRKLVTLNVTGGVPRENYYVLNTEGKQIGKVASGMFCPTAGTYSANAFVPPEYTTVGTRLKVEIRGTAKDAEIIKRPLFVPVYRRKL